MGVSEREALEPEVVEVFDDFWRSIVMPEGEWDLDQVKRELYDYRMLIAEVPKVYDEITGGAISKPNTVASAVLGMHEERCPFATHLTADEVERVLVHADYCDRIARQSLALILRKAVGEA